MGVAATELSVQQKVYLTWLADPQRAGTKGEWAADYGVSPSTLQHWEKNPLFRRELKKAVVEEITDPQHIHELALEVRAIALRPGPKTLDSERLKAVDLYVKMVDRFGADAVNEPAERLTDEELLKSVPDDHPGAQVLRLARAAGVR